MNDRNQDDPHLLRSHSGRSAWTSQRWYETFPFNTFVPAFMMMLRATGLSIKLTWAEFRRRNRNYLIGLFTVVLVVLVVGVLINGTSKSGVIFLKLAEEQTGEIDMLFLKNNIVSGTVPFLNSTEARKRLQNSTALDGMMPRWLATATVRRKWGTDDKEAAAILMVVDSAYEDEAGMGRGWKHRPLGEAECHLRDTIARQLGIRPNRGEHVIVDVDVNRFLQEQNLLDSLGTFSFLAGSNQTLNSTDLFNNATRALNLGNADIIEVNVSRLGEQLQDLIGGNITVNGTQNISVADLRAAFPEIVGNGFNSSNSVGLLGTGLARIQMDLNVIDSVGDAEGKYPSALGNVVLVDSKFFLHTLIEQLCYESQRQLLQRFGIALPDIESIVDRLPLDDYALLMLGLFSDRVDLYTQSKPGMDEDIVRKSDDVMSHLGIRYNATVQFPLALAMQGFYFLQLFLDQIFNAVVLVLTVLGCILIYALLLSNVEEKTYEHGMMRALGFRKSSLMNLITVQALAFAIPGVGIALVLLVVLNIAMEEAIADFANFPARYGNISVVAIIIAVVIGFAIPLLANIVPIKRALGKSLRDALDISHQTANDTEVTMHKLETMGLKLWQTLLALFMVGAGFMVYYMMPYAFIFDELPVFFLMLLLILMGMLLGLCLISGALQSVLEKLFLRALLWGKDKVLRVLILKNLSGHRSRSSKTYMMFTISTAAIIFGGVVFTLQAKTISKNIDVFVGADLQVMSTDFDHPLDRNSLEPFLKERLEKAIDGYAFITFSMDKWDQIRRCYASNLLFFPQKRQLPRGIDQNFLDVVYIDYFLTTAAENLPYKKVIGTNRPDIVDSLYTYRTAASKFRPPQLHSGKFPDKEANWTDIQSKYANVYDVMVSAAAETLMSLSPNVPMKLQCTVRETPESTDTVKKDFLLKPRALMSKLPGFPLVVSSYQFGLSRAPLLMPMDSFEGILRWVTTDTWLDAPENEAGINVNLGENDEDRYTAVDLRYEFLFVRLREKSQHGRETFVNEMKVYLSRDYHHVNDAQELKDSTASAIALLMAFFYVVSTIAIMLNLFLLWISFTTNVKQNAWAFAVMRATGFTVAQLVRAYIYEALCTVLSAFMCGTVIGTVIALTLSAQFNIFNEMPFDFDFPWIMFLVVLAEAIFAAIVGSWWPAQMIRKKEIAQVLKAQ